MPHQTNLETYTTNSAEYIIHIISVKQYGIENNLIVLFKQKREVKLYKLLDIAEKRSIRHKNTNLQRSY